MRSQDELKKMAAQAALQYIEEDMIIGVGSGSTVNYFIDELASIKHKIDACVASSHETANRLKAKGIPVIDTELSFQDPAKLLHYCENYNFFCATTWMPDNTAVHIRNREKRSQLIDLLDQLALPVISLVDPWSRIAANAVIGRGVFIDCFTIVESGCMIDDYATVYGQSGIGHHTRLMRNSVIQRYCSIAGDCVFEPNTFVGTAVKALKTGAVFGAGTFIHEAVYIRRGTVPNEVVKINGDNMSRVRIL